MISPTPVTPISKGPQVPPQPWRSVCATHGTEQVQDSAHHEVGDLDLAGRTQTQQTNRVPSKIKPVAGKRLSQASCNEQWAGDQATGQQIAFHDQHPAYRRSLGASHQDVVAESRYRT